MSVKFHKISFIKWLCLESFHSGNLSNFDLKQKNLVGAV